MHSYSTATTLGVPDQEDLSLGRQMFCLRLHVGTS